MNKFEKQICDFLSNPDYRPVKAQTLTQQLKLSKKLLPAHKEALQGLLDSGKVVEGSAGRLMLKRERHLVTGIIKRTLSGAGYVVPHDAPPGSREADVFVSQRDIADAHTGDEVVVRLLKRRRSGGQRCGRVEEIVVRATSTFVGTYFEQDGQGYVQVDGKTIAEPVVVGDPGAKGVQQDDKVVIEMLRFPTHYQPGEAVLTKVLGPRGKPGIDTQMIIHEFGLPLEFPEAVLEAARAEVDRFDETDLDDRQDLTGETIITIDPADARDFDDAISLTRSKDGHWHLGVHIADVAHFVTAGGALDREARLRGTSIYLPGQVIPMLTEVISNGLASLQKGKLRYAKSVFIEFTAEGVPVHTELVNSAIKVTRRFAYEEVMPIVEEGERSRARVSAKVRALLVRMHELAMILRRRRFEHGALELTLSEVGLELDKNGRVVGAHEIEYDESHQMIEEFMLAANIAVATELADRAISFLRRVHGDPDERKLRAFAQFVAALGYSLKRHQSRGDLQALLKRVHGEPTEHAINFGLLRSLKQAEYTPEEKGHYALAVENYCHFTSPIRRYPDLTIHRLVDRLVIGKGRAKGGDAQLTRLGKHCSDTERRAEAAERELKKIKLLEYMAGRVGEDFDAIVTGVERFGIFCQLMEVPVEGMIHISALDHDDYFDHDPSTFTLVGRRTGKQYRLGDRIHVNVVLVDVDRRVLELRIVERPKGPTRRPSAGARKRRPAKPKSTPVRQGKKRKPSKVKPSKPRKKRSSTKGRR